MEYEGDSDTNCNWCAWNNSQRVSKETGKLGNERKSGVNPDYSIIKIGQNIEKSPGNLRIVWVLWHINLCRLFNAKSIFIPINSSILDNSI